MASKNEWAKYAYELPKELESKMSPKELEPYFRRACLKIEADAKARCPVDTGTLRGSIQTKFTITDYSLEAEIGSPLFYAPYIEWGTGLFAKGEGGSKAQKIPWTYYSPKYESYFTTSGMKPQPFLIPALESNKKNISRELDKGIEEVLRNV